ncbi:MAG: hypothetical protein H6Q89_2316, partial [Myxococcaceae bacterium]|nr:hypothetical protein [Myxococcaceae bacterium]
MAIPITDPTAAPVYGPSPLHAWCQKALYDPRDEVLVRHTLKAIAVMLPILGLMLFRFHWALAAVWLAAWIWLLPPTILMLHNTMHRPFLRRPRWLDAVHPYLMSALFGIPTGYMEHHIGMHHAENNLPPDLSSTMKYQRDNVFHFLAYFFRFFFFGVYEVPTYLAKKKSRRAMARRMLIAEFCHWGLVAGACLIDVRAGVIGFAVPLFMVRFLMMMGNWGQHAFIDQNDPGNSLLNSISCINAGYNHKAWNDGYHIGHHVKANRHWTELPTDFEANIEVYARAGCVVFRGLDFFLVSLLLFTHQYKILARR